VFFKTFLPTGPSGERSPFQFLECDVRGGDANEIEGADTAKAFGQGVHIFLSFSLTGIFLSIFLTGIFLLSCLPVYFFLQLLSVCFFLSFLPRAVSFSGWKRPALGPLVGLAETHGTAGPISGSSIDVHLGNGIQRTECLHRSSLLCTRKSGADTTDRMPGFVRQPNRPPAWLPVCEGAYWCYLLLFLLNYTRCTLKMTVPVCSLVIVEDCFTSMFSCRCLVCAVLPSSSIFG
jgi:hypothetical protein